jgi:hypothetical protein
MPLTSIRSVARKVAAVVGTAAVLASAGCGDAARTGRSSAILIIGAIEAASGADPTRFGNVLNSDVETLVPTTVNGQTVQVPTVFNDPGTRHAARGDEEPAGANLAGSRSTTSPSRAIT